MNSLEDFSSDEDNFDDEDFNDNDDFNDGLVTLGRNVRAKHSSREVVRLPQENPKLQEVVAVDVDATGKNALSEVVVVESDLRLADPTSYNEDNLVFSDEDYEYDEEILTHSEAQSLTDNIKSTANLLYLLLNKAYKGRAWIALGHKNFEEYVRAEFSISRSRAYQLLNQAKVIEEIESVAPKGTKVEISEASARELRLVVDELTDKIKEATTDLDPEEAEAVIQEIVSETRKDVKRESEEDKRKRDILSKIEELENSRLLVELEEEEGKNFGEDGELAPESDNSMSSRHKSTTTATNLSYSAHNANVNIEHLEKVHLLYSTLGALNDFPEPKKIIDSIPPEKYELITKSLPEAVGWLNSFNEEWNEKDV